MTLVQSQLIRATEGQQPRNFKVGDKIKVPCPQSIVVVLNKGQMMKTLGNKYSCLGTMSHYKSKLNVTFGNFLLVK